MMTHLVKKDDIMLNSKEIESRLRVTFPTAQIKLSDMTGGGDHWQLVIESESFKGKTMVEQHQSVYRALGEWMKKEIHALALTTKEV